MGGPAHGTAHPLQPRVSALGCKRRPSFPSQEHEAEEEQEQEVRAMTLPLLSKPAPPKTSSKNFIVDAERCHWQVCCTVAHSSFE